MIFVRNENLRVGMRLAKPIYDKKGVLLYERDSKLTPQGIESVSNFGIIGLYILEPAEPLPPMSPEDIEFERFTQATSFAIADELKELHDHGKLKNISNIVTSIIKGYGNVGLGNIIGANLFNLLLVMGIPAAVAGIPLERSTLMVDVPVGFLVMAVLIVPILLRKKASRLQGILLLAIYGAYCWFSFA